MTDKTNQFIEKDIRTVSLKRQIQYWINNPTKKLVEKIEIFY